MIQIVCDQCGAVTAIGESVVQIQRIYIRPGMHSVEPDDIPTVVHWACIVPLIQRLDAEDKEPPF